MAMTFINHVQRVRSQQGAPFDHSPARAESSHGFRADAWRAEHLRGESSSSPSLSTQHSEQSSHPEHRTAAAKTLTPEAHASLWWRIKGFCRCEPFIIITATKDLIIHAHSDTFQRAKFRRIWRNFGESGSLEDSFETFWTGAGIAFISFAFLFESVGDAFPGIVFAQREIISVWLCWGFTSDNEKQMKALSLHFYWQLNDR